tara:strand:- start:48 stop:314 length:267 start_codon:yes stop_codon:yes gene_type:complete
MSRYKNTQTLVDINGRNFKGRTDYQKFPLKETDTYYVTISGDRLDLLAQRFYQDVTKWWIIAEANSLEVLSYEVKPGLQLRIPQNNGY